MTPPNFKTVDCVFFKQNRCLKGDRCTFRHGEKDTNTPPVKFMRPIPHWHASITQRGKDEIELCKKLNIETWETYPRKFYYLIHGNIEDCKKYYNDHILHEYPNNPYFTMITNEGENYIEVSRYTSCS
jgi:hypothetical protein